MTRTAVMVGAMLLASAATVQAQQVEVGLKGGANFARIAGDDIEDAETRTTSGFGAFLIYRLSDRLAVQPEMLLMNKGTAVSDDDFDVNLKLRYIEFPLLARISLGAANGAAVPYVIAGPALSFNSSCSVEVKGSGVSLELDCDEIDDDGAQSVDFSLVFGGGAAIPVGALKLFLEGRYTHGLLDVFEDEDTKNRTFSLFAGVSLPLGGGIM